MPPLEFHPQGFAWCGMWPFKPSQLAEAAYQPVQELPQALKHPVLESNGCHWETRTIRGTTVFSCIRRIDIYTMDNLGTIHIESRYNGYLVYPFSRDDKRGRFIELRLSDDGCFSVKFYPEDCSNTLNIHQSELSQLIDTLKFVQKVIQDY